MGYSINQLPELRKYFRSVFGLPIGDYTDGFIIWLRGMITIDIVLFDKAMHKKHPGEEEISLADLVYKYYGDEGVNLLDELLWT